MKCPKCGVENTEGAKFCKGCGESLQTTSFPVNSTAEAKSNNNTLIICVTLLLCVIVIAGAFILLSNGSEDSGSSSDVINDANNVTSSDDDYSSSVDDSAGLIGFDEASTYFPEASDTVLSHVFDEADSNGDGVLSDSEFAIFEKVRDHTKKYANNVRNDYSTVKPSSGEKSGYCADHGRVAVVDGSNCPYCIDLGFSDTRTKTSSW